jgi:hypothetical protein
MSTTKIVDQDVMSIATFSTIRQNTAHTAHWSVKLMSGSPEVLNHQVHEGHRPRKGRQEYHDLSHYSSLMMWFADSMMTVKAMYASP